MVSLISEVLFKKHQVISQDQQIDRAFFLQNSMQSLQPLQSRELCFSFLPFSDRSI
jgi:hypothetical protein